MSTKSLTPSELIAPCGMNCSICMAYLREKNKCPGCRAPDAGKPITRLTCKIKTCEKLHAKFCFDCEYFPCDKLKHLDTRYRTKYHMGMIENLQQIKKKGLDTFVTSEKSRWKCPHCEGTICVHKGYCSTCLRKT